MPLPDDSPIQKRVTTHVPINLWAQFRLKCEQEGKKVTEVLLHLIHQYVTGGDIGNG